MSEKESIGEKLKKNKAVSGAVEKVKKVTSEKKWLVWVIAAAVVIALIITVAINMNKGSYEILFPGMSQEENAEVYSVLKSRDVDVTRNEEGEVMVQAKEAGDIMLDMSMLGYPKSTLPFDIFSDNSGFTTTEFEKKQYLLLNLQDRIERTLKDMTGIKSAIVTLNVPDDSQYVWEEEDESGNSTGSVSISMIPGNELSAEKVSAIKNLVANSVPRLAAENVTVVNADTLQEFTADDSISEGLSGVDRLDFEKKVEDRLVKKIGNVLSLAYSPEEYRVSATVVIDYDKMITEETEYVPEDDGNGVVEHSEDSGSGNGADTAGGVAGEENNTDVPDYTSEDGGNGEGDTGSYYRTRDYVISNIKKQIEKDNVKLQKATVAIALNDESLTEGKIRQIVNSVSKAANIEPEDIVVTGYEAVTGDKTATETSGFLSSIVNGIDWRILVAVGAALLVIIILAAVLIHKRRKRLDAEEEAIFADEDISTKEILDRAESSAVQNFINKDGEDGHPKTPTEEVRSFAKTNPEIIAAMISSWLKEGE